MAVQPPNRTIILVGMMGAGKSTIGKALAALMGTKFVDLDRELEERCGVSIPHIFETEGEAGFRCRETRLLQEYARAADVVVATGGGVVIREENREILKASPAVAVHLKVSPEECFRRTQALIGLCSNARIRWRRFAVCCRKEDLCTRKSPTSLMRQTE